MRRQCVIRVLKGKYVGRNAGRNDNRVKVGPKRWHGNKLAYEEGKRKEMQTN